MPFRALISVTSAAVSLKSNMEQAMEHKRLACVLFLDLYLKRSLSEHEGEKQSLVATEMHAAFLLSKSYI